MMGEVAFSIYYCVLADTEMFCTVNDCILYLHDVKWQ